MRYFRLLTGNSCERTMAENLKEPNEMGKDYYDLSFLIFLEFFPNLDCFKEIEKKYN